MKFQNRAEQNFSKKIFYVQQTKLKIKQVQHSYANLSFDTLQQQFYLIYSSSW